MVDATPQHPSFGFMMLAAVKTAASRSSVPLYAPVKRTWRFLRLGIAVAVGLTFGLSVEGQIIVHRLELTSGALHWPWNLLWIFAAIALAIVAHEVGHMFGALLARRRIVMIGLFPFNARFDPFRIWISPRRKAAGYVISLPFEGRSVAADLFYYAGGILANAASWWLARAFSIAHYGTPAGDMAGYFAAFSAVLAIVNLVPFRLANGIQSDGMTLLSFLGGRALKGRRALGTLDAYNIAGIRPRDWPRPLVDELFAMSAEGRLAPFVWFQRHVYLLDVGEKVRARDALLDALACPLPALGKGVFFALAARFVARLDGEGDTARTIMSYIPATALALVPPLVLHRAWASVYVAQGDMARAADELARTNRAAQRPGFKLAADDREDLDWMAQRIDQARAKTAIAA